LESLAAQQISTLSSWRLVAQPN